MRLTQDTGSKIRNRYEKLRLELEEPTGIGRLPQCDTHDASVYGEGGE